MLYNKYLVQNPTSAASCPTPIVEHAPEHVFWFFIKQCINTLSSCLDLVLKVDLLNNLQKS